MGLAWEGEVSWRRYLRILDAQVTLSHLLQKSEMFPPNLTLPRTSVTDDAVSSFSAFKLSPTTKRKSESCYEAGEIVP